MNEPNSLGDTIVLAEDDGKVTILEPREDPDANLTPKERKALMDYMERIRKLYRRGPPPPDAPLPSNNP
jgi:hypothetical protein